VGSPTPAYTLTVTTDMTGVFTLTWPSGMGYGADIRVKNRHTLANRKPNVTVAPGNNHVDFGLLHEGDANGNNLVELGDFSILAGTYDAFTDSRADFNESHTLGIPGDVIDLFDFSLLANSFGQAGDVPVAAALVSAGDAQPVALMLAPAAASVRRGQVFAVDLRLDPRAQPFQAVSVYLSFNPAELQVVDAAGNAAAEIDPGGALPIQLANSVDNEAGQIRFSAGILAGTAPAEEFSLGTLHFKAVGSNLAGSAVQFVVQADPPRTAVAYGGFALPLEVTDLRVRIAETQCSLPIIGK